MMVKKMTFLGLVIISFCCMPSCFTGNPHEQTFDLSKALNKTNVIPVVIIGSGSAGLPAAIYTRRAMIDTLVVQGSLPGGLLTQTTEVENWPGEVTIQGPVLMEKMREHAQKLGVEFLTDTIEKIDFSQWPYKLVTGDDTELHALSVIIATGATPKRLGIPGEDEYFGRGVGTCAKCDAAFYKNDDVAIVGGGDSAIEESIQIAQYAKSVTILVRKDAMRAAVRMQERLKAYPSIKIRYNVEVKRVLGDELHVTGLELYDVKTQQTENFPVAGLFLAIGHVPNSQLFVPSVKTDAAGYILTEGKTQHTSLPGVFAAGEIEDNKYRQAIVSAGRGASAGIDAVEFLTEIGYTPSWASKLPLFKIAAQEVHAEVKEIESMQDFTTLAAQQGFLLLDFYTPECAACLNMMPIVQVVAAKYQDRMKFFKVDAQKLPELADKYFVQRVPCFIALYNGKLVARYNDIMNRQEFIEFVDQVLEKKA